MQHTTKYQFSLIETSDPFSPDALNANAKAVETELAQVEAAHAADKAALEAEAAANKAELADAAATNRAELDAALKKQQLAHEALAKNVGVTGKTCRMVTGSYKGKGTYGEKNKTSLDFDFYPVCVMVNGSSSDSAVIFMRGSNTSVSSHYPLFVEWREKGLSWYSTLHQDYQLSVARAYPYVAFGYDPEE